MYNNGMSIKDYVSLFIGDATNISTGVYEWDIPATYYTNQRSTVCTVSVVGSSLYASGPHTNLMIEYRNGARNTYSQNNNTYIISHTQHEYSASNTTSYYKSFKEDIELLTTARPEKIRLRFLHDNGVSQSMGSGCVTLKFCYYNAEETNHELHNQYTNTLK